MRWKAGCRSCGGHLFSVRRGNLPLILFLIFKITNQCIITVPVVEEVPIVTICASNYLNVIYSYLTKGFKDGTKLQHLPWPLFTYGIRLFGRIGWTAFVPYFVHLTLRNRLLSKGYWCSHDLTWPQKKLCLMSNANGSPNLLLYQISMATQDSRPYWTCARRKIPLLSQSSFIHIVSR